MLAEPKTSQSEKPTGPNFRAFHPSGGTGAVACHGTWRGTLLMFLLDWRRVFTNDSSVFAPSLLINAFFCLGFVIRGSGPCETLLLLLLLLVEPWCSLLMMESVCAKANLLYRISQTHVQPPQTPSHAER